MNIQHCFTICCISFLCLSYMWLLYFRHLTLYFYRETREYSFQRHSHIKQISVSEVWFWQILGITYVKWRASWDLMKSRQNLLLTVSYLFDASKCWCIYANSILLFRMSRVGLITITIVSLGAWKMADW